MEINDAAAFLVGTLLIGLAFCIMGAMVLFLNNIFSKYWKPINWKLNDMFVDYQPLPTKKSSDTENNERATRKKEEI